MKAQLEQIRRAAKEALASFDSAEQLEKARIQYLGKKGELTAILKQMGKLSAEERPVIGQLANEIRKDIEDTIANKSAEIKKAAQEKRLAEETLDVTMPGTLPQIGYKHPLSIVLDEIKDIFMGMGFDIAEGPEVEYDYYNFEALNLPPDHPARDTQDTFAGIHAAAEVDIAFLLHFADGRMDGLFRNKRGSADIALQTSVPKFAERVEDVQGAVG